MVGFAELISAIGISPTVTATDTMRAAKRQRGGGRGWRKEDGRRTNRLWQHEQSDRGENCCEERGKRGLSEGSHDCKWNIGTIDRESEMAMDLDDYLDVDNILI